MRIASLTSAFMSLLCMTLTLPLLAESPPYLVVTGLMDDMPTQQTVRGSTELLTLHVTPATGRTVDPAKVTLHVNGRAIAYDADYSNPAAGLFHYSWQVIEADNASLVFRAEDDLGQDSSLTVAFAIDASPPYIRFNNPDESPDEYIVPRGEPVLVDVDVTSPMAPWLSINNDSVQLTANGRVIPVNPDLSDFANGRFAFEWQAIEEGNVTLTITAEDNLGQSASASTTVSIDPTPPVLAIRDPYPDVSYPRGGYIQAELEAWSPMAPWLNIDAATVTMTANGRNIPLDTDLSHPETGRFIFQWQAIEEGSVTLAFSIADELGQTAEVSTTVTVEATPPVLAIRNPDPGNSYPRGGYIQAELEAWSPMAPWLSIDAATVTMTANGRNIPLDTDLSHPETGRFIFQWQAIEEGSVTLAFSIADELGQTAEASMTVTVEATPPVLAIRNPDPGNSYPRGGYIQAELEAWSPMAPWLSIDAATVTMTANGRNIPLDTDLSHPETGRFIFQWQAIEEGSVTLAFSIADELGQAAETSTTVTVEATPPFISLDNIYEGMQVLRGFPYYSTLTVQPYYGLSVDPASVQLTINGIATPYNSELSDVENGYFHFDLQFTDLDESAIIVFRAADNLGQTTEQSLTVAVEDTPPSLDISGIYDGDILEPGQEIWIGMYAYPQFYDWGIDPSSAQMIVDGSIINADPDWSDPSQNFFYFRWTVSGEGDVNILFRATDEFGQTGEHSLSVVVQPANLPPVAEANLPSSLTDNNGDGFVQLTGDASASTDPDGDSLSFEWVINGLHVSYTAELNTQLTVAGDHLIRLIVTDSHGARTQRDFPITIHPGPSVPDLIRYGQFDWTQSTRSDWYSLDFNHRFENPVVIAQVQTYNGNQPFCLRVRNVTATGCEIQLQEWAYLDGSHIEERIAWLAVEQGEFDLPDGSRIVAGVSQIGGDDCSISYASSGFNTAPVVLAQTQGYQISNPICTRLNDVSSTGFKLRLQQEEVLGKPSATEQVGWIARSQLINPNTAVVGKTADNQNHDWRRTSSNILFGTDVLVFPAMQDLDGGDTSTVRIKDVEDGRFDAKIEEEQSRDNEIRHTTETIGYWIVPVIANSAIPVGNG